MHHIVLYQFKLVSLTENKQHFEHNKLDMIPFLSCVLCRWDYPNNYSYCSHVIHALVNYEEEMKLKDCIYYQGELEIKINKIWIQLIVEKLNPR
jgi:hypothetical protein